jgi:hypothetical protein
VRKSAGPESTLPNARALARVAISELFLDSELADTTLRHLRDQLRATGLSIEELDAIYYREAAPVLHWNTRSVAGVWDGFDPVWLEERCEAERNRRWRLPLFEKLRRYCVTRSTIADWRRLRQLLLEP